MKKYLLFALIFLSISKFVFGQENDSLLKLYDTYEKKITNFTHQSKSDSVLTYLNKMEKILKKLKDSTYFYRYKLNTGTYLTVMAKYDLAMQELLQATRFFEMQQDSVNYYNGKYRIGVCYYYINRRKEAKQKMLEVVKYSKYVSEQTKINALSNLGALDIELGMINHKDSLIQNSKINLRKAIALNLKNNSYSSVTNSYSLLAEAYNQLNDSNQALKLLDSAIFYAKRGTDKTKEAFALVKKANIYTTKKQLQKALPLIDKAIAIYVKANHIPTKIYAYGEKKKLLVAMQKYKEASIVSDSIYSLSILNYNKRFVDGISEMKVKYKTAEKERKILEQRADIAEKGLLIQKKNYQIYGFVGLLILLTIFGYFIYNQQKLKQHQLIKEAQLKTALQKIETQNKLQEQRLRISRDLHDNIGAQLSFIISSIDNLKFVNKDKNPQLTDKLTYISSFTTTTIQQLRDTIWAMNKNEITITDLQSRTLTFIENAKRANSTVRIKLNFSVHSQITFTSIKGIHVFRVIQEAINNALKYAKAEEIIVQITELDNELQLQIKDNGTGFDIKNVSLGNGLKNMQDRMDEIGGKLSIKSSDKGTEIKIRCNKFKTNKI